MVLMGTQSGDVFIDAVLESFLIGIPRYFWRNVHSETGERNVIINVSMNMLRYLISCKAPKIMNSISLNLFPGLVSIHKAKVHWICNDVTAVRTTVYWTKASITFFQ